MSLSDYKTIYVHGLYSDLLRQFVKHGDSVFLISPFERRNVTEKERVIKETGATIVKIKIWNMQKTNILEKSISMLTIDGLFMRAIKKYLSDVKFDLILYPTPPITILKTIEYVKKRDKAKTYLLLKDIFPQGAVDLGAMSIKGISGFLYRYFREKEKKFYAISDHIGCMSQANVDYILKNNPKINSDKVEICPNTTDPMDMSCSEEERVVIRKKYKLPLDVSIFVYGGNLGKPQGIPFMLECLRACINIDNVYFLIIGNGTEYGTIAKYISENKPNNVRLMQRLSKEEYDRMIGACDVGLIFLDHRFTIPNFPSRLLGYMAARLPVLACTDPVTDIGKTIVEGGFGWWCESNKAENFVKVIKEILEILTVADLKCLGQKAYKYLEKNYSAENDYQKIMAVAGKNYGKC